MTGCPVVAELSATTEDARLLLCVGYGIGEGQLRVLIGAVCGIAAGGAINSEIPALPPIRGASRQPERISPGQACPQRRPSCRPAPRKLSLLQRGESASGNRKAGVDRVLAQMLGGTQFGSCAQISRLAPSTRPCFENVRQAGGNANQKHDQPPPKKPCGFAATRTAKIRSVDVDTILRVLKSMLAKRWNYSN